LSSIGARREVRSRPSVSLQACRDPEVAVMENRNVSLNRCSTMIYIPAPLEAIIHENFCRHHRAILIILSILVFLMAFVLRGRPTAPIGFIFLLATVVVGTALDRTGSNVPIAPKV
jgi:hypothetical protein